MTDRGVTNGLLAAKYHSIQGQASVSTSYGACTLATVCAIKEEEEEEEDPQSTSEERWHHRDPSSESGFVSDCTRPHSSADSSLFCSTEELAASPQEEELFRYMEKQTTGVELELRKLAAAADMGTDEETGVAYVASTVLTTNTTEEDYDSISISSDYVSVEDERKHCKSAFGVLCYLKHEVHKLKSYFESECIRLALHSSSAVSTPDADAQRLLSEDSIQRQKFSERLDTCLDSMERQMDDIRHKNDFIIDGVMHKRHVNAITATIQRAPIGWVNWLHILLFGALICLLMYVLLWYRLSDKWIVCLRLVRSPLLVVLLVYLYGINMKVWAWFKIDYITIFNHTAVTPTPRHVFRAGSVLTVLMTLCIVGLVLASPYGVKLPKLPIKIAPMVMWLCLLAFLLNPLNLFLRSVRYSLLRKVGRIVLAPFFFVYFPDFYLADQFNSVVALFCDLQYTVCYLSTDPWTGTVIDTYVCTSSANGIRPLISLLPAFWRFLQCCRCFYNTRNAKHLVNAGKYSTMLPVILFATLFSVKVKGDIGLNFDPEHSWIVICWLISSFVHAAYTFLWDVCCDWGLLFKRKLVYRRWLVYVVAMLLDFVFRFLWTVKLAMAIVWEKDSDLLYTGVCCVFVEWSGSLENP